MKIELKNHPAQARHPITEEPLWIDEEKTQPVPLFPDERAIYLDGYLIGYCGVEPDKPVRLTACVDKYTREAIVAEVTKQVGKPNMANMPPPHTARAEPEEEIEDDDE